MKEKRNEQSQTKKHSEAPGSEKSPDGLTAKSKQGNVSEGKSRESVPAKRKIMDRVRRGYPDGPGGSYDGF